MGRQSRFHLYWTGVGYVARSNEKIEPAYSVPPDNEYCSGGPNSASPFEELGLQGRRFVTDVVTPDEIERCWVSQRCIPSVRSSA